MMCRFPTQNFLRSYIFFNLPPTSKLRQKKPVIKDTVLLEWCDFARLNLVQDPFFNLASSMTEPIHHLVYILGG